MQVNLSDINHELGKAKENIVNETGNYLGSSQVGSLIRSESTKFGNIFGAKPKDPPSLPKSTSLPVIQGLSPEQYRPRNGSSTARHLGSNIFDQGVHAMPHPLRIGEREFLNQTRVFHDDMVASDIMEFNPHFIATCDTSFEVVASVRL